MPHLASLAAALALAAQQAHAGQEVTAESKDDFDKAVTKGSNDPTASVVNVGGNLHLRSGAPGKTNSARIVTPIDALKQIKEISFNYQYISGYSDKGGKAKSSTFELWIQDESGKDAAGPLYTSPPLEKYSYDKCNHCYSPAVSVSIAGCPACAKLTDTPHYFVFRFQNNERNCQLLLPIEIQIGHNDWDMFLVAFFTLVGTYLAVGTLHGTFIKKKKGLETLPHPAFWGEVGGLVKDGLAFSLGKVGLADNLGSVLPFVAAAGGDKGGSSDGKNSRKESLMSNGGGGAGGERKHRDSVASAASAKSSRSNRSSLSTKSTKSKSGSKEKKSKSEKSEKSSSKSRRQSDLADTPEVAAAAESSLTMEQRLNTLSEVRDEAVHPSQAPIKIVVD
eukprot:SAG22_NODE_679_length_7944_cov_2.240408_5_plen_392_part_00